ncbi:hypothetical protein CRE_20210 [Caenorhabditis remanei]|uniref:Uncharacterized protein n=2 Tax=Caenorhabditis remanei TaxID=31234 RepID=E3MCN6_CAERE|nr:hypothetical protein CRE_20210 [Caenorhabditis remanei]
MTSGIQYQIIPLADREHNNKVASLLETKYKTAIQKRVTLNERFGVLEKGYALQATDPNVTKKGADVFFVVHDKNLISKKEFIENYVAKNPNTRAQEVEVEEDKENAPSKKSAQNTTSAAKKEITTEEYLLDITKSILKPI